VSERNDTALQLPPSAERSAGKAQRLRLRFARGEEASRVGHLDLARIWERACVRAGLALSYSGANRKQPRITLAAGLPVGVTSDGELIDVVLARRVVPGDVARLVQPLLPAGMTVTETREVGIGLPSLPASVRWADYEVDVPVGENGRDVATAIERLLASSSVPWRDTRGERERHYDLRPLVQSIEPGTRAAGLLRLRMRLRAGGSSGVGRPDQVLKALGLPGAARIHRLRLVLSEPSPAREAWRRRGRYL
jgi:radical SAM-linked protein